MITHKLLKHGKNFVLLIEKKDNQLTIILRAMKNIKLNETL